MKTVRPSLSRNTLYRGRLQVGGRYEMWSWASTVPLSRNRAWLLVNAEPQLDADGGVRQVVCTSSDITERKRAEEALRESEQRFKSSFEDASIGMTLVSIEGRFLQVNQALCEIVGCSEEELLNKTFHDIIHPDDLETDLGYVQKLLSGEIRTYQMEKRYLHKHGHMVWILLNGSLVRGKGGEPLYFIGQIQDITKRKKAEEEIRRLNETLEEEVAEHTAQLVDRERRLKDLVGKLVTAQEEERRRVAYEVHNGPTQVAIAAHQHLQAFADDYPPGSAVEAGELDLENLAQPASTSGSYLMAKIPIKGSSTQFYTVEARRFWATMGTRTARYPGKGS